MTAITFDTDTGNITTAASSAATASGPAAVMAQNTNGLSVLQYPRNLGTSTRGHSVQFTIQKINSTTFSQVQTAVTNLVSSDSNVQAAQNDNSSISVSTLVSSGQAALNKATNAISDIKSTTSTIGVINLYMPETVNFGYNAQYDKLSLVEAASSIPRVSFIAKAITGVLDNPAARLGLNAAGYVFNPQNQILFEGIDFRTYQMSFTFTPYNADEATQVDQIIKMFRQNAAPTLVQGSLGMFYTPPSIFNVSFLYNGAINPHINQLKRSVIENIEVNYSPNGQWAAHGDGTPVQTTLTMSFKEIDLVTSTDIQQGF
jgi:Tail-tube assembly protein